MGWYRDIECLMRRRQVGIRYKIRDIVSITWVYICLAWKIFSIGFKIAKIMLQISKRLIVTPPNAAWDGTVIELSKYVTPGLLVPCLW